MGEGLTVGDFDQGLLLELINIEKELANATSKFTPSSKVIKGLKSRFEQIQPILLKKQLTAVDTALNLTFSKFMFFDLINCSLFISHPINKIDKNKIKCLTI